MSRFSRKIQLAGVFSVLLLLAVAVSCKGFFVNPTLTGITVTCPACSSKTAPNLTGMGTTAQLQASGDYDDGSSKTLTGSVDWSSADDAKVSVNNTTNKGRVTAEVASTTSSVAITATDGTISGQVAVTVGQTPTTVTCTSCTNNSVSLGSATTVSFSASAASDWTANNNAVMTISQTNSTTATGNLVGAGSVTVTATPTGSGAAGTLTITVTN